jgi:hypothetical protein
MGHRANGTFNALVNIEHLRAIENIVELSQSAQTAGLRQRPMKCLLCGDTGWVCETHPDRPFCRTARLPLRWRWSALPQVQSVVWRG